MLKYWPIFYFAFCALLLIGARASEAQFQPRSAWGIDACISIFANAEQRPAYMSNLRGAEIRWLRERSATPSLAELQDHGFKVVSFLKLDGVKTERRGNQLPEDLLAVFYAAEAMQRKHGAYVDAWEMVGEPDLGYCTDLPDRVAAYQKAVYLGIKRGAEEAGSLEVGAGTREPGGRSLELGAGSLELRGGRADLPGSKLTFQSSSVGASQDAPPQDSSFQAQGSVRAQGSHKRPAPLVLMGALGMPPGPWLERATRNGLLDYTDAYNFHFYGHAKDFTSTIEAHAAFVRRWETANKTPRGAGSVELGDGRVELGARSLEMGSHRASRDFVFQIRGARPADPGWGIRFGEATWAADVAAGDEDFEIKGRAERPAPPRRTGPVRPTSEPRPARRSGPTSPGSHLQAHGSPPLPLWITEAGHNAVDPDDFLNPARRQLQADFTVSTARQALAHPDVAMFMPFILVHKNDPYALTLSPDKPLPAWDAYAAFTRENPWPNRPLARIPENPNPIVVQWLPDNKTTVPHKVSGTYRFVGDQPIVGEIRVYNFSEAAISGSLKLRPEGGDLRAEGGAGSLELRAGRADLPGSKLTSQSSSVGASTRPDGVVTVEDPMFSYSEIGGRAERPAPPRRTGPVRPTYDISIRAVKDNRPYRPARSSGPTQEPISQTQEPMDIVVPAMSMVSIPVTITPVTSGYFREFLSFEFVDETGRVSPLYFGVERTPVAADFVGGSLELTAERTELPGSKLTSQSSSVGASTRQVVRVDPNADSSGRSKNALGSTRSTSQVSSSSDSVRPILHPMQEGYVISSTSGPWVGINGVQLAEPAGRPGDRVSGLGDVYSVNDPTSEARPAPPQRTPSSSLHAQDSSSGPTHPSSRLTAQGSLSGSAPTVLRVYTPQIENDPMHQPMAVARIAGLPKTGFLYLKTDRPMSRDFQVRVDLVDRRGHRFAIWENVGVSYFGPKDEAWLNLEDFHAYIWSPVSPDPKLHPEEVVEIQLRFYLRKANAVSEVTMELRQPRRPE